MIILMQQSNKQNDPRPFECVTEQFFIVRNFYDVNLEGKRPRWERRVDSALKPGGEGGWIYLFFHIISQIITI